MYAMWYGFCLCGHWTVDTNCTNQMNTSCVCVLILLLVKCISRFWWSHAKAYRQSACIILLKSFLPIHTLTNFITLLNTIWTVDYKIIMNYNIKSGHHPCNQNHPSTHRILLQNVKKEKIPHMKSEEEEVERNQSFKMHQWNRWFILKAIVPFIFAYKLPKINLFIWFIKVLWKRKTGFCMPDVLFVLSIKRRKKPFQFWVIHFNVEHTVQKKPANHQCSLCVIHHITWEGHQYKEIQSF